MGTYALTTGGSLYDRQYMSQEDLAKLSGDIALAQRNYLNGLTYSQAMDEWNKEQASYSQRMQLAAELASHGNFAGYRALGLTDTQIAQLRQDWVNQLYR